MSATPLIIAAHGTRVEDGVTACGELVRRVGDLLPGVAVEAGFVELTDPPISVALQRALAAHGRAVVVPLMIGQGGHVREDIPEAIAEGKAGLPDAPVRYARHLGPDPRLRSVLRRRIETVLGGWPPEDTHVILLGRGCSVPMANADHVHLARMLYEEGQYAEVWPAFIQVTQPSLFAALDRAYAGGARRIVVSENFLFPGRLRNWTHKRVEHWRGEHPDAQLRITDVIGPCDELAAVVVDRYLEEVLELAPAAPAYLSGLMLGDREVLVVGGGRVSERRIPRLLEAGARVRVVAPELTASLRRLAEDGHVTWDARGFGEADLDGAWYVMANTDDPTVNARVAELAERHHAFCVRADDALGGSAWTPTVTQTGGFHIAVLGNRQPRRSAAVREAVLRALRG